MSPITWWTLSRTVLAYGFFTTTLLALITYMISSGSKSLLNSTPLSKIILFECGYLYSQVLLNTLEPSTDILVFFCSWISNQPVAGSIMVFMIDLEFSSVCCDAIGAYGVYLYNIPGEHFLWHILSRQFAMLSSWFLNLLHTSQDSACSLIESSIPLHQSFCFMMPCILDVPGGRRKWWYQFIIFCWRLGGIINWSFGVYNSKILSVMFLENPSLKCSIMVSLN